MEMTAAIQALKTLETARNVMLYSDSQLLIKTMTLGWKRKKNHDLWSELDRLSEIHRIEWQWVRGHNGHPENEACDNLAQRAASKASRRSRPPSTDGPPDV
jgi:ribonuclease HI